MRIRYMSDLHLEFTGYSPSEIPSVGESVVILAGDIGIGLEGVEWACHAFPGRDVLYVFGNHEYYNHHFVDLLKKARAISHGTKVRILENESVVIDGVRFLGSTLWTDFSLFGSQRQHDCMQLAEDSMTDYSTIFTGPIGMVRRIKVADTLARHKGSRAWLHHEIGSSSEPCIVVTHHGPSYKVCVAEYQNDLLTSAFLSNCEELLRPPVKAWIFGHTHQVLKHEINGIPVLSNQRGYPSEEVPGFGWDTCFDLSENSNRI